jgi:hypothetical protein
LKDDSKMTKAQVDFKMTLAAVEPTLHRAGLIPEGGAWTSATGDLWVPGRVRAADGRLWWRAKGSRTVVAPGDLLLRFVRLADQDDGAVLDFAAQFGVLQICPHNMPSTHNRQAGGLRAFYGGGNRRDGTCEPPRKGTEFWEQIAVWRRFARRFRACLTLTAWTLDPDPKLSPRRGSPERSAVWADLRAFNDEHNEWPRGSTSESANGDTGASVAVDAASIASYVNRVLRLSDVRPFITWHPPEPASLEFRRDEWTPVATLFGVLALQLACAVSRSSGVSFCTGCGAMYNPTRRPSRSRRRYCDDCRDRARWRDAQQKKRGLPPAPAIAESTVGVERAGRHRRTGAGPEHEAAEEVAEGHQERAREDARPRGPGVKFPRPRKRTRRAEQE